MFCNVFRNSERSEKHLQGRSFWLTVAPKDYISATSAMVQQLAKIYWIYNY